ncbi:MAG: hypothetical protein DI626_06425 [Micavibrio aeruginosavorus]|uniref:Uncharacterized protein n=1 Tax=Micavibrio aeruginosavorus TaxID=349221 RepID=A0A2W5A213_9BACT|nr:MAG: hypothetical protein DI626_06425 [Micavibrio aeruginosavorus]
MIKLALIILLQIGLAYPVYADERSLTWGLGMLKSISGIIGAAEACNNGHIRADAISAYRAALKALVKNGVIPEEDISFIIDMNARTALTIKKDFLRDGPISCSELPETWQGIKADMGL